MRLLRSRRQLWPRLPRRGDRRRRPPRGSRSRPMPRSRPPRRGVTLELFADEPTSPGLVVTFDGPNGSGKTSLAKAVADHLRSTGRTLVMTAQPSPTELGDTVRAAEASVAGRGLACLVAGDRHHQIATEILPALRHGAVVLCDRYVESSLVLQRIDGVD